MNNPGKKPDDCPATEKPVEEKDTVSPGDYSVKEILMFLVLIPQPLHNYHFSRIIMQEQSPFLIGEISRHQRCIGIACTGRQMKNMKMTGSQTCREEL